MQYKYYKCLQKKFLLVQMSKSFIWIPIKRYKCCSGPNGMTWYEHMKHKPSYHVYRDQFNTASWHHVDIAPDFCAIRSVLYARYLCSRDDRVSCIQRSVKQGEKFKLRDLVTWRSKQATAATGQARSLFFDITSSVRFTIFLSQLWELLLNYIYKSKNNFAWRFRSASEHF